MTYLVLLVTVFNIGKDEVTGSNPVISSMQIPLSYKAFGVFDFQDFDC